MRRTRAVIATLAALFTTQAMGGDWTPHTFRVKNQNCVWQGLRRTNEVKIHVWYRTAYTRPNIPGPFNQLPPSCSDTWVTIHAGQTAAVKVDSYMQNFAYVDTGPALECTYEVEPEGVWSVFNGGYRQILGAKDHHLTCKLQGNGVCWCGED
jgi:hypothetical protein